MHLSVCFAKRDERASAVRERNLNKWVKLRSSMS
jgi:hypothetical protein